jgi:polyisoprenoid-binding protein YceI
VYALVLVVIAAAAPAAAMTSYRLDTGTVRFETRCLGILAVRGRFTEIAGALVEASPGSEGVELRLRVPARSLKLGAWTERLLGPSFLDAARYPAIDFTARTPALAPGSAEVDGTLLLHGIRRTVRLHARIAEPGPGRLRIAADLDLDRSDYGLSAFEPLIGDRVRLSIELELLAQGARAPLVPPVPPEAQRPAPEAAKAAQTFTVPAPPLAASQ